MQTTRYITIACIILFCFTNVKAQDIHFSQFYNSPLTLNPALTGSFDGTYRFAANFRRQWASIPPNTPFVTTSGSADMNFEVPFIPVGSTSGGILFFHDQSGLGKLSTQTIMLSPSYHYPLNKKHAVSIGFQPGIVIKSIDYSSLTFNNQYADQYFDPTLPNGEANANNSITYFDLNAGLSWNGILNDELSATAGIAFFHLTQPNESFLEDEENKLNMRWVLHSKAEYKLNEEIGIHPGFLIMDQNKEQEVILGSNISYLLPQEDKDDITVFGGLWIRSSVGNKIMDAVFPTAGMEYKNLRATLSYDVNVSSLSEVSGAKGGPELSLIYIIKLEDILPVNPVLPCIRF